MEKTLTIDQAVEAFRVWMDDEYDVPSGSMTESEEEGLRFRLNAFASPPTLNIGMGEEDMEKHATAMCGDHGGIQGCSCSMCGSPLGPMELTQFCPGCGTPVDWPMADGTVVRSKGRANAHTKAVTVEAIVKLAEEWDAYCVVTPADPDGIEDFRARLLKLIQQ